MRNRAIKLLHQIDLEVDIASGHNQENKCKWSGQ
jgi:hypothetical protein